MKRLLVFIAVCMGLIATLSVVITIVVVRHTRAEESKRESEKCVEMLQTVKEFQAVHIAHLALGDARDACDPLDDRAEIRRLDDLSSRTLEKFEGLSAELERQGFWDEPCLCPEAPAWLAASEALRIRALKAKSQ